MTDDESLLAWLRGLPREKLERGLAAALDAEFVDDAMTDAIDIDVSVAQMAGNVVKWIKQEMENEN